MQQAVRRVETEVRILRNSYGRAVGIASLSYAMRSHLGAMPKTDSSIAIAETHPTTDVPAISQVTFEIGLLLAVHLALALAVTVAVQAFVAF